AFFSRNPEWPEPITSFIVESLSESLFCCGDHVFYGKAKLLQQVFERGRSAESAHANHFAFCADMPLPAKDRSHLDGNARGNRSGQDAFFVRSILLFEELPRRNAD